jgi:hypothetical protein
LLLKENPTTYNQLVCAMSFSEQNTGAAGRYRNGSVGSSFIATSYDGVVVSGTTYYKIYLK